MWRPSSRRVPLILLGAGLVLLAGAVVAWLVSGGDRRATPRPPTTVAPTTTTAPPPVPAPAPPQVVMSWRGAGAFVARTGDVDPTWLGRQLRENGFTWLAVLLHDGADAEAEYAYTNGAETSAERLGRSRRFVSAFRGLEPDLPAALSSYCRADTQDIDWAAWSAAGFAFLPQAYVNAQGPDAAPAACAASATRWFPADAIHPTVGSFEGVVADPAPGDYAAMLDDAGTTGFSIYLAETDMSDQAWKAYGDAIARLGIAQR